MQTFISRNVIAELKQNKFQDSELEKLLANQIVLDWPALLNLIDLDDFVRKFPKFTDQDPLYQQLIHALESRTHPELLEHLFDQVFVECLNWVRDQKEIEPSSLINAIRQKQSLPTLWPVFSQPLTNYATLLLGHPYLFTHDLIFYLAWDRVCVNLAVIFEYPSVDANVKQGLALLRGCLIESFQHIMSRKETSPSFFRFIEALYAYEMREENLQTYSDHEWLTLCESAQILRNREAVIDVTYIDQFIVKTDEQFMRPSKVLTMDAWEKINKSIALARYMIDKLNSEDQNWHYALQSTQIISLTS